MRVSIFLDRGKVNLTFLFSGVWKGNEPLTEVSAGPLHISLPPVPVDALHTRQRDDKRSRVRKPARVGMCLAPDGSVMPRQGAWKRRALREADSGGKSKGRQRPLLEVTREDGRE